MRMSFAFCLGNGMEKGPFERLRPVAALEASYCSGLDFKWDGSGNVTLPPSDIALERAG
jgi:hypothetical protein